MGGCDVVYFFYQEYQRGQEIGFSDIENKSNINLIFIYYSIIELSLVQCVLKLIFRIVDIKKIYKEGCKISLVSGIYKLRIKRLNVFIKLFLVFVQIKY